MPDNAEERKSVAGIVTPNSAKDDEWRTEVAGVFAFTEAATGGSSLAPPMRGPCFSPVFSPVNRRIVG